MNQYYNCRAGLYVTNLVYRRTDAQEDNRIDGSLAILRIDRSVRQRFELIAKGAIEREEQVLKRIFRFSKVRRNTNLSSS